MNSISKFKFLFRSMILLTMLSFMPHTNFAQASTNNGELNIKKIASSERSFFVLSTILYGKSESVLFDGMYKISDGKKAAAEIEKTGTKLKAIILSHADHDHYMGAMEIVKRFPGTPVYTSQKVLDDFLSRSESDLARERRGKDLSEVPDELVKLQLIPKNSFSIDGHVVEIITDLTGDVKGGASLGLWIPSSKTLLTGDLVFDGMHAWTGFSDFDSRDDWRASLERLLSYRPVHVIPGHKVDLASPDGPEIIEFMIEYLKFYDQCLLESKTPDEVITKMKTRYPKLVWEGLLNYGTRRWFKR